MMNNNITLVTQCMDLSTNKKSGMAEADAALKARDSALSPNASNTGEKATGEKATTEKAGVSVSSVASSVSVSSFIAAACVAAGIVLFA